MSDWESICADAQYDEEQEKLREEYFPSDDSIEGKHNEILFEKQSREVILRYQLIDYYDKDASWERLKDDEKLGYCFSILEPIKTDKFPLLRQVHIFTNLVNLDMKKLNYYRILECAFYNEVSLNTISVEINPIIPIMHYDKYLKNLYTTSTVKTFSIPLDSSTEYLQGLFEIWFEHKVHNLKAPTIYKIRKILTPYDARQIHRYIKKIPLLLH
ncbi:hypothetical protein [Sulfurimonas sp. CS5]|uniref:hypothetical protein n=1 Tax=Sulfurimonas sp. CS5 TaxID=3391145 RepID=UPI0039EC7229